MEFFAENTIRMNSMIFLAILFAFVLVVLSLFVYIVRLKDRLKDFQEPRYGFLGKTVYPAMAAVLLGGTLFFTFFGLLEPRTDDVTADVNLQANISASIVSQNINDVTVNFAAVPVVDGKNWGNAGSTYDLYWKINGSDYYEQFEFNRSSNQPSGFLKQIPRGGYTVDLLVIFEGEQFNFSSQFDF